MKMKLTETRATCKKTQTTHKLMGITASYWRWGVAV